MTEEFLRIKISELKTIRVMYQSGEASDLPIAVAMTHKAKSAQQEFNDHLIALARCIEYFSGPGMEPTIEFVVPARK